MNLNRQIRRMIVATAASMIALACANPLNQVTFDRYVSAGMQAKQQGDLAAADEAFGRAVVNARIGRLGAEKEAGAIYERALVKRDRCEWDQAEQLLVQSLEVAESGRLPDGFVMRRLSELSQLHFDRGRYAEALPVMERATSLASKVGLPDAEPAPYAEFLTEYAVVLRSQGDGPRAAQVDEEAKELRKRAAAAGAPPGRSHALFHHTSCAP